MRIWLPKWDPEKGGCEVGRHEVELVSSVSSREKELHVKKEWTSQATGTVTSVCHQVWPIWSSKSDGLSFTLAFQILYELLSSTKPNLELYWKGILGNSIPSLRPWQSSATSWLCLSTEPHQCLNGSIIFMTAGSSVCSPHLFWPRSGNNIAAPALGWLPCPLWFSNTPCTPLSDLDWCLPSPFYCAPDTGSSGIVWKPTQDVFECLGK